jgi:hypothetical protein
MLCGTASPPLRTPQAGDVIVTQPSVFQQVVVQPPQLLELSRAPPPSTDLRHNSGPKANFLSVDSHDVLQLMIVVAVQSASKVRLEPGHLLNSLPAADLAS